MTLTTPFTVVHWKFVFSLWRRKNWSVILHCFVLEFKSNLSICDGWSESEYWISISEDIQMRFIALYSSVHFDNKKNKQLCRYFQRTTRKIWTDLSEKISGKQFNHNFAKLSKIASTEKDITIFHYWMKWAVKKSPR